MAGYSRDGSVCGEYGFPVKPYEPGKSSLQAMSEAAARQVDHDKWHEDHPGEMCNPADWPASDYADIERGQDLLGAMTFEPGDAFVAYKKGK